MSAVSEVISDGTPPVAGRDGAAAAARAARARNRAVRIAVLLLAIGVLAVICLLSIAVGARSIPLGTVWQVLWTPDGSEESFIVHEMRIPRTVIGILVGVALGLAGAVMQALTRNPLAEPGLLGVNMGASIAVVVAIAYLGVHNPGNYVYFAFAGAAAASVLVYLLGSTGRAVTPERMVLAGAAITAALGAAVDAILITDPTTFDQFRYWLVGSLAGRRADVAWQLGPYIVVGALIALALARALNALALGDETGRALGARIGRTRLLGALAVMLLCGAATALAGPIAFIGLAVPHMVRVVSGPDHRWLLPYSVLLAPVLLLGADIVGRLIVAPGELEVGIVTAVIGAPVFIALCRRRRIVQT